jgi:hypothetical protein
VKRLAADGSRWKSFVEALCSYTGDNRKWWWWWCHEDIWKSGGITSQFLLSALEGGEWSASRPGSFTSEEISTGTHWIGGWLDPRDGLDAEEKTKKPSSCQGWDNGRPVRRYTDWAVPVLLSYGISVTVSHYGRSVLGLGMMNWTLER